MQPPSETPVTHRHQGVIIVGIYMSSNVRSQGDACIQY